MADAKNGGGEASSSQPADSPTTDPPRSPDDAQGAASTHSGAQESAVPSKAASRASSTRNSTPAAASLEVRPPAHDAPDASSAMEDVQESHDPASTASKPAHLPSKDSEETDAAPSSYGTRSRNRPGRSRPNYAEDTEMDFEMAPASMNGNVSDPSSRSSLAPDSSHSSTVGGKKGAAPAPGHASWGNSASTPKDVAASLTASTASPAPAATPSNPPPPATKRRKNAAASATNGGHASAAPPSQTGGKRGTLPVMAAHSARETNMMTFEHTGAFLKKGRLEADDGQTVSVNGKF